MLDVESYTDESRDWVVLLTGTSGKKGGEIDDCQSCYFGGSLEVTNLTSMNMWGFVACAM